MSNILKGLQNEVRGPIANDEPLPDVNPYDELYQKQDLELDKNRKKVDIEYHNDIEGIAPNGKKYNKILLIKSQTPDQAVYELKKFNDLHWGAKQIVDKKLENVNNTHFPILTIAYYIDNHKYGYLKPFNTENKITETHTVKHLATVLFNKLETLYSDIVTRNGHEVVGDIVSDVAELYSDESEIGSTDISHMIKIILRNLQDRQNLSENNNIEDIIKRVKSITSEYRNADMHTEIINKVYTLASQLGVDVDDLTYRINKINHMQRTLASEIYKLDEPFLDLLRKNDIDEGQIYSTGGGCGQAMRYFKPKEKVTYVDEKMVMGVSSDASSAGSKVQGEAVNPAQQAAIAIAMKKAGKKPKGESAIMKGLVDENLGTPYPGTYEQETQQIRKNSQQERVQKIAF